MRGVLFDVYGTLLISAAGDIGSGAASWEAKCAAMTAALDDAGVAGAAPGAPAMVAALEAAIRAEHTAARARGVAYPEVDLRELWRRLLPGAGTAAVERAAVSYECRTNPVWPMPGAAAAVAALQARGPVGIVSNAQFFTPLVLAALLPEVRFDPRLAVWSFAEREAKPSPRLFAAAAARLARHCRLQPRELVMVGNDVRNDLLGARAAGLRTALFAGDARSLRLRRDDPRCAAVCPDLVLTGLSQLPRPALRRHGSRRDAARPRVARRAAVQRFWGVRSAAMRATRATIDLARLRANLLGGGRPPARRAQHLAAAAAADLPGGQGQRVRARRRAGGARLQAGVSAFGVATVDEGVALREAGIDAPILLFSLPLPEEARAIAAAGLTPLCGDAALARDLARAATAVGRTIDVHLKIDTGMARVGCRPQEAAAIAEQLRGLAGLRLTGLCTHFARSSEADQEFSRAQLAAFHDAIAAIPDRHRLLHHAANSGAIVGLRSRTWTWCAWG